EAVIAVIAGGGASEADEILVAPRRIIMSPGIGLPDFHQRVRHRLAVAVPHGSENLYPPPFDRTARRWGAQQIMFRREQVGARAQLGHARKVGAAFPGQPIMEEGPDGLPWSLAEQFPALIVHLNSPSVWHDARAGQCRTDSPARKKARWCPYRSATPCGRDKASAPHWRWDRARSG